MPRGIRGQQIADDTVESVDIKDGSITNDDINSSAAIEQSKIDSSTGWIKDLTFNNFVTNGDFEIDTAGWSTSDVTITRNTTDQIFDTASGEFAFVTIDATADAAMTGMNNLDKTKSWKVEFYYTCSGSFVSNSVDIYLLCDSTEVYISSLKTSTSTIKFVGYVNSLDATTYKLRFKTSTGIVSSSIIVDGISVYPHETFAIAPALTIQVDEAYTVESNVTKVMVDTTSGDVTITIPDTLPVGSDVRIKKVAAVNKVIINRSGSEVFNPDSLTSLELWHVNTYYDLEKITATIWNNNNHQLYRIPYTTSTSTYTFSSSIAAINQRDSFDCTTMVPPGSKTVLCKGFLHARSSSTTDYCYFWQNYLENNTSTPNYTNNSAQLQCIGTSHLASSLSYIGAESDMTISLNASRYFYSYNTQYKNVSTGTQYLTLLGYYL